MVVDTAQELQMSQDEFAMIRDYIHERSGIYFADNRQYIIRNRLSRRMAELDISSVRDYYYHVKYDASLREASILIDLITTNETSFFRNEPQLLSFSREVLPDLVKRKRLNGGRRLKVWSAGCSSGEEPYTLAILLRESLVDAVDWTVEVQANDISETVLKKARRGEYSQDVCANVAPDILARHFLQDGDVYRVCDDTRRLVTFSHLNLNDQKKVSLMSDIDVIFCRNVMIYFSDDARRRLVRSFYSALRPGGFLYLGHSETLHGVSKAFKLVYLKNSLVYQKAAEAESSMSTTQGTVNGRDKQDAGESGSMRALDLLNSVRGAAADTVSRQP
jgi:chemotaxis protein methyltransferase CheR